MPGSRKELERAAHGAQLGYIGQARQAGRNWYEIGEALGLYWAASANKESIVVEAYHYAQQLHWRRGLGRDPVLDQRDHDRDHQRPDRQVVCAGKLRRGE